VFSASVINLVESSDFRQNQLPILGNLITCHLQIIKYQNLKVSCFALNQLLYCNFPVFLVLCQSFSLTYSFKLVLEFFLPGFMPRSNRCSSYLVCNTQQAQFGSWSALKVIIERI
jgi:hypothetical protein